MALTELSYVGGRSYIRGADLYVWFERQIASRLRRQPVALRQFRMVQEVARDGAWCAGDANDASATLDVVDAAGQTERYSFSETGAVITRKVSDIPSNLRGLTKTGAFAGRATLAESSDIVGLLNGLIEANKGLHVETLAARGLPSDRIRLIYIEDFPLASPSTVAELEFRHLGERKARDRIYTLNAVRLPGSRDELRICYSY